MSDVVMQGSALFIANNSIGNRASINEPRPQFATHGKSLSERKPR